MAKKRAFISFDFDHDGDIKTMLAGQARNPDTPFEFADWSVKEAMSGNWKEKVRDRIRRTDVIIVLCGASTHTASGVAEELRIAREENKPCFLLAGRADQVCTKPTTAKSEDKVYQWTWDNLKALIDGAR